MLTAAPKMLCLEIFRSAPYSTTVPKKPALQGADCSEQQGLLSSWIPPGYHGQLSLRTGAGCPVTSSPRTLPTTHSAGTLGQWAEQSWDTRGAGFLLDSEFLKDRGCRVLSPTASQQEALRNVTNKDINTSSILHETSP